MDKRQSDIMGGFGEKRWSGKWNGWIAPFHFCPRCNESLNWSQEEDALEKPYVIAAHCGVRFYAPLDDWDGTSPPAPESITGAASQQEKRQNDN